jgi:hypothetical protein
MSNKLYMVFDVESAGLHGEGFAFGYVVVDETGTELESGFEGCDLTHVRLDGDMKWVYENVMPALPWQEPILNNPRQLRDRFWKVWLRWKEQGAVLVTDCGWPVEANFLSACIADAPDERRWNGPYPLFDVSSVLLAFGCDPVGTFERKENELPAHNPLCDARQSARVLIETMFQR